MEKARIAQAATSLVLGRPEESSALSARGTELLRDDEFELLNTLMKQMQAYYPHQEFLDETVEGYQFDMERLAVKFGVLRVREVLLDLRLRAGQRFFPHPVQVLEELEAMAAKERDKERAANRYQADPNCVCLTERPRMPGYTWVIDKDGDRVIGRCPCFKQWDSRGQYEDRKSVAAGV